MRDDVESPPGWRAAQARGGRPTPVVPPGDEPDEEGPGAPEARRLFCRFEEGLLQRGCLTTVAEDSNDHDGEGTAADAPDTC